MTYKEIYADFMAKRKAMIEAINVAMNNGSTAAEQALLNSHLRRLDEILDELEFIIQWTYVTTDVCNKYLKAQSLKEEKEECASD